MGCLPAWDLEFRPVFGRVSEAEGSGTTIQALPEGLVEGEEHVQSAKLRLRNNPAIPLPGVVLSEPSGLRLDRIGMNVQKLNEKGVLPSCQFGPFSGVGRLLDFLMHGRGHRNAR